ncbi:hypothetical protein KUCAC02_018591 [Chaenocephalus aceratus]|uniref:Uncharacterized protein n=1 Tax=Chaenocephalus aceratus TaxID=36190 RepID=A0ACB9W9P0_CHAAC|nr:hypothetical protein KUCAC02_018591 [Chaenocephalus aceratus]
MTEMRWCLELRPDEGPTRAHPCLHDSPGELGGASLLYRDIWSLRASLEQYASSDHSSTDRESIRSDADSSSSFGGAGAPYGLDSCLSQDLDDEHEGEGDGGMMEGGIRGASGGDSEVGSGAGGESEAGNRKLLRWTAVTLH